MTDPLPASPERPLDTRAIALILLLCLTWGFNQVVIKLVLPDIPPLTQAALRSLGGLVVIVFVAKMRGAPLFRRDGTLRAGLFAGVLFGIEFILMYRGLVWTTASRAVVFLYTAPFFVASAPTVFSANVCPACNGSGCCCRSPALRWRSACRSRMSIPRCCWAT
jgi:hypothetical protein